MRAEIVNNVSLSAKNKTKMSGKTRELVYNIFVINLIQDFPAAFFYYIIVIAPGVIAGFFASGLIHEFAPEFWVKKGVGRQGLGLIIFVAISGALLPLCSWAELPLALSFYKKGAKLGPVLTFLLTAPATSIVSLILMYQILGLKFVLYNFCAVILMGAIVGIAGNLLKVASPAQEKEDDTALLKTKSEFYEFIKLRAHKKTFKERLAQAFKYGFVDLAKEIGPWILAGIVVAALVSNSAPLKDWIRHNLSGLHAYSFVLVLSATMINSSYTGVFLANAFMHQGLPLGPAMCFLLLSPVLSYGTVFVLKKEFGLKVVCVYVGLVVGLSLLLGYFFPFL